MTIAPGAREQAVTILDDGARNWKSLILRISGGLLVGLVVVPLYSLLDRPETGLAGSATAEQMTHYAALIWLGTVLIGGIAALALLIPERRVSDFVNRLARVIVAPPITLFAIMLALFSTAAAAWFLRGVLDGQPDLIDSFAQLTHARLLAEGALTGTTSPFWHLQQTVVTEHGWASQYPPGYIVLLALGFRLGAVWLVGPLLLGMCVFSFTLAAERLLPNDLALARLGALLAAISPFAIAQAGSFMSHTAAAAFGAIGLYCFARARTGADFWFALTGFAGGTLFSIRPYTGLTIGALITLVIALDPAVRARRMRALGWMLAGALPIAIAVGWYNATLFDSPFRFGYSAALGPAGGLGFQVDPWGNTYGIAQALAYTSAELLALSLFLLESPFPVVAIIGVVLLLRPRVTPVQALIGGWALLPVIANLFYWHHGLYRGPRMLADVVPAWVLLCVLAFAELARAARGRTMAGRYSLFSGVVMLAALVLVVSPLLFGASRLLSYERDPVSAALLRAPEVPDRALVFVHGGWTARLAARLAAAGMRLDSVESALRQNSTCAVHEFAQAYERKAVLPALSFEPRPTSLPAQIQISEGNRIRVQPGERMTRSCTLEINADRAGVVDAAPLIWQGALTNPATDPRPIFVRDLGPDRNRELLARHVDRVPLLYGPADPEITPRLWPYDGAIRALWGVGHVQ
ncbi:MAG: hypothetical protein WEE89_16850 [Gemmatimonadota bacterium]